MFLEGFFRFLRVSDIGKKALGVVLHHHSLGYPGMLEEMLPRCGG
jgi:hypothetical protein